MLAWVATGAAVVAALAAVWGVFKLHTVYLVINSRMDELLKAALAQGRQDERDQQDERKD